MRLRLRFSKLGKVRWTSHRDVARMWERAFRRVQLPLAYTQGFSPRPRVSFGLALPTGAESLAEYLDAEVAAGAAVEPNEVAPRLAAALPIGIDVTAAAGVDAGESSLQEVVTSSSWVLDVAGPGARHLDEIVERALAATTLVISRERKGRVSLEDVRPAILSCEAHATTLVCELAAQPRTLRPSELLAALGGDAVLEALSVRRTHQWIERDGVRAEPLALPPATPAAPHAETRRAS